MKILLAFSETPNVVDSLEVKRRISQGNSTVYQVYCEKHVKDYLLKIFPKNQFGKEKYEKEKLVAHFKHPNIIQYIPIVTNDNILAIAAEHAKYGNFSQLLKSGPLKNEVVVRTYFHQLIEGIEYIHSQGFTHLDLKPENLVIGSDFMLKIIDFDTSQLISDNNFTSIENSQNSNFQSCQTESVFEPQKNPTPHDIFSAGAILFALKTAKSPFQSSNNNFDDDSRNPKSYSYFYARNKEFWTKKSKTFFGRFKFNKDFIKLVNWMLNPNPDERPTIQEIKDSAWYKGPVLDMKDLKAIMRPRLESSIKSKMKNDCIIGFCLYSIACFCCLPNVADN